MVATLQGGIHPHDEMYHTVYSREIVTRILQRHTATSTLHSMQCLAVFCVSGEGSLLRVHDAR